jgi:hypothetical protein
MSYKVEFINLHGLEMEADQHKNISLAPDNLNLVNQIGLNQPLDQSDQSSDVITYDYAACIITDFTQTSWEGRLIWWEQEES